jgi:uncharacterized 2Fe-2S/4Fe-4S cluster protein (DUF4445 family)
MSEREVAVTFQPTGRTVYVLPGTCVLEAAAEAGTVLEQPCGGTGKCGKCRVVARGELGPPTASERELLSPDELLAGWRLGCQTEVTGAATIEVPATSRLAGRPQILLHGEGPAEAALDPAVRKQYVELPAPGRDDDRPDVERLGSAVGRFDVDLDLLRELPGRLRDASFRGTAVLSDGRLIDFEPGDATAECYACAVDVGTTSLVASLVDLCTGEEVGITSRVNPQTRLGDDVMSRITHARRGASQLDELHRLVAGAVDGMIGELAERAGIARERIYELTFSGNTTMQQLLLRVDPLSLGEVPFVPALGPQVVCCPAAQLGLRVHPRASARTMPVIGGFIGGDTTAGILVTGMAERGQPVLLVDVGTNGEIVLAVEGRLMAASTAAGPAFEGARISCGMRGSSGAIEKVVVDGRLRLHVIDGVAPVGLCGSGLIDTAAELLRHKLMAPEGRLRTPDELPDDVPDDLVRRVTVEDGQVAFLLADAAETGHGRPVTLRQRDLREFQLASGAIRAGVRILLGKAGLRPDDLSEVLIAGGFGNFIRRSNAQRVGLLPGGIERSKIRYQGNTSLAGARLVALSQTARQKAEELAARTERVDLSTHPDFAMAFAESMIFPDEPAAASL